MLGIMTHMRYLEAEGVWLLNPPAGESFEIIIVGDGSGPSAARRTVVEKAVSRVTELRLQAISYLEGFVERRKFAEGNDWYFEGISSGRAPDETESQFRLNFSIEGDAYGEWSVSFQESASYFHPVAFSRRQT